jgi:outer membrane assembly lipoprotein YfiO
VIRLRSAILKLTLLLPLLPVLAGCGAGVLPTVHSEAERLDLARRLYEKREYGTATELLKTYVSVNAGSENVDEAIYLLGECYLKTKDWVAADAEFERLLRDYPESDSAGSASFRLGEALFGQARPPDFDQESTQKALAQWQSYLQTYPGHWLNAEAERRIGATRHRLATKALDTARLYLKLGLPVPARVYFLRIVQDYGDTPVVGDARYGLALCEVREGHRAEALERLLAIEKDFAGQPLAERAAHERKRLEKK